MCLQLHSSQGCSCPPTLSGNTGQNYATPCIVFIFPIRIFFIDMLPPKYFILLYLYFHVSNSDLIGLPCTSISLLSLTWANSIYIEMASNSHKQQCPNINDGLTKPSLKMKSGHGWVNIEKNIEKYTAMHCVPYYKLQGFSPLMCAYRTYRDWHDCKEQYCNFEMQWRHTSYRGLSARLQ